MNSTDKSPTSHNIAVIFGMSVIQRTTTRDRSQTLLGYTLSSRFAGLGHACCGARQEESWPEAPPGMRKRRDMDSEQKKSANWIYLPDGIVPEDLYVTLHDGSLETVTLDRLARTITLDFDRGS